jgi:hypothetical protein
MPLKKRRKREEPWKQVKRRGRILVGQPPASRTHQDPREKRPKHKKRDELLPDEQ